MVRAIGFRVEPQTVNYAVVEGTKQEPILILYNKISPPKSYDQESSQLVWYRERLLTIIEQYQPQYAAIRFPEPNSFNKTKVEPLLKRARIEGVILESLGNKGIECIAGALQKISSEINSKSAKQYLSNDNFRNLDWSNIKNGNQREAILVAVTQLED
jgi:Holliday junction resolvasome RuvABC endonuclease subunit